MLQSRLVLFITILLSAYVISSCGGGGSGLPGDPANPPPPPNLECTNGLDDINVSQTLTNQLFLLNEYHCYKLDATEGIHYEIQLTTLSGGQTIAVYPDNGDPYLRTPIVSTSAVDDRVIFTAEFTGSYYFKVYGNGAGEYRTTLNVLTDAELPYSITSNELSNSTLNFVADRNGDLPATQTLDISGSTVVNISVETINASGWLSNQVLPLTVLNSGQVEVFITDINLPIGENNDTLKLTIEGSEASNRAVIAYHVILDIDVAYLTIEIPTITNASYGVLANFNINAPIILGDPVNYSLVYGPTSMQVAEDGLVSWLPDNPTFGVQSDHNFGIRAQNSVFDKVISSSINLQGDVTLLPYARTFFTTKGVKFSTGDFDGNGTKELVAAGAGKVIYTFEPFNQTYRNDWALPFDFGQAEVVTFLAAEDINNDNVDEIIISTVKPTTPLTNRIRAIDKRDSSISTILIDDNILHNGGKIDILDLDGDGNKELIYVAYSSTLGPPTYYQVVVYDLVNNIEKWRSPNMLWPAGFELANIDSDPEIEIILGTGVIYDGANFSVDWDYGSPFSSNTYWTVGDVTGDNISEILYRGSLNTELVALSGLSQDILFQYTINTGYSISKLLINNIDADPINEVWINNIAYEFSSAINNITEEWTLTQNYQDIIGIEDFDNDGDLEIAWFSDASYELNMSEMAPNFIAEATLQGDNNDLVYLNVGLLNINVGEQRTTFIAQSNITRGLTIDANGVLSASQSFGATKFSSEDIAVTGLDYDGDLIDEIAVGGYDFYNLTIDVFDFSNDLVERAYDPVNSSFGWTTVQYGDVNRDSNADILALNGSGNLSVYDAFNDVLLGQNTEYIDGISPIQLFVSDTNGDNVSELFILDRQNAGSGTINLRMFSNTLNNYIETGITNIAFSVTDYVTGFVDDVTGNGEKEIVITNGLTVVIFNQNLVEIGRFDVPGYCYTITAEQRQGSRKNLFLGITDSVQPGSGFNQHLNNYRVIEVDPLTGQIITSSPDLIGRFQKESLNVSDVDNDGNYEMSIGTGQLMYLTQ